MPEFEIKIKPPLDASGATGAAEALDKVADKSKDLNTELDHGTEKLEKHGHSLEEAGHHAHLFGEHHHEAHAAVKGLGEILPGVGQLAREMFSVQTLGIGLVAMGLSALIEHFQSLSEEEKKFTEEAGKGLGTMLDAQAKAAGEAATKHAELAAALSGAAKSEGAFLTSMNNRIKTFHDYIDGLEKVGKAEDEAEEKRVRRAVRDKQISEEQGQAQIDAIHGRAQTRTDSDKDREAVNTLQQHTATLHHAEDEKKKAEADKAEAEARENAMATPTEAFKGNANEARKRLYGTEDRKGYENTGPGGYFSNPDSLQGKLDAAQKVVDDMMQELSAGGGALFGGGKIDTNSEAFKKRDEALAARDQGVLAVKSEEEAQTRREAGLAAAKAAKKAAEDRISSAQKTIDEYGGPEGAVAQEEAKINRDRATRQKVDAIRSKSEADAGAASDAAQDRAEAEAATLVSKGKSAIGASQGIVPSSAAARVHVEALKSVVEELTKELEKFTQAHYQDDQGLAKEIADLKRQVQFLSQRAAANRTL